GGNGDAKCRDRPNKTHSLRRRSLRARVWAGRNRGCYAILLAGRHVPTGWHEALIGRLLSAACLDALGELAESFAPGSMRDFVAHCDDKRHRPLDDLE